MPVTAMMPPCRTACSAIATVLVTPWSVRAPVAFTLTEVPSTGNEPRSIGWIVLNMAVGKLFVSIAWCVSWSSRWGLSLRSAVRSAVIWTLLTTLPVSVIDPEIFGVRPTAVWPPTPTSCSWTR